MAEASSIVLNTLLCVREKKRVQLCIFSQHSNTQNELGLDSLDTHCRISKSTYSWHQKIKKTQTLLRNLATFNDKIFRFGVNVN